jgi:hypothetical protein
MRRQSDFGRKRYARPFRNSGRTGVGVSQGALEGHPAYKDGSNA